MMKNLNQTKEKMKLVDFNSAGNLPQCLNWFLFPGRCCSSRCRRPTSWTTRPISASAVPSTACAKCPAKSLARPLSCSPRVGGASTNSRSLMNYEEPQNQPFPLLFFCSVVNTCLFTFEAEGLLLLYFRG